MFQIILLTNTRQHCVRWRNAGCPRQRQEAVEPAAFPTLVAAGSLVLRRMDRRGHKKGLVRAKKSGTKSGTGALAGLDSTREWGNYPVDVPRIED